MMGTRRMLAVIATALVAAVLGLAASVAINGPGPLLRSQLGQRALGIALHWNESPGQPVVQLGEIVPPFSLPEAAAHGTHALPTGGKLQILNYWATWCAPCLAELPLLTEFARTSGDRVAVAAVALDERGRVAEWLRERPLPFPVLIESPGPHDSSVRLGNRRGVLPYSVVISARGRLLKQHFGSFADQQELDDWAKTAP